MPSPPPVLAFSFISRIVSSATFWASRGHRRLTFSHPSRACIFIPHKVRCSRFLAFHAYSFIEFCSLTRSRLPPSFLFFASSGGWGKIKAKLTTLRRIFIRTRHVSISLSCVRNPVLTGVSFGARNGDSASCPYRRSPLLLQQRKLPLHTDAGVCQPDLTPEGQVRWR